MLCVLGLSRRTTIVGLPIPEALGDPVPMVLPSAVLLQTRLVEASEGASCPTWRPRAVAAIPSSEDTPRRRKEVLDGLRPRTVTSLVSIVEGARTDTTP